jgi:DNA-binding NarL/FixJ family response regulator
VSLSSSSVAPRSSLITVTVVERNDAYRAKLCAALSRCPGVVIFDQCADGATAEACLDHRRPRVLIVGDTQPGQNGWNLISALRSRGTGEMIVALSDLPTSEHIRAAFRAGALGYFLRRTAATQLPRALAEVMAGGAPMSPEIARTLVTSYARPARPCGLIRLLTEREREILELLSLGVRYREVGIRLGVSRDTVHSHAKKIYLKLRVTSKTEAALVLGRSARSVPSAPPVLQRAVA